MIVCLQLIKAANYFRLGPVSKAYRAVDRHARKRLRQWLCAKHKVSWLAILAGVCGASKRQWRKLRGAGGFALRSFQQLRKNRVRSTCM
ncbi:MAG: group II intron maturase-specific domain-containing protein [Acidobacteriaceae bacterium]